MRDAISWLIYWFRVLLRWGIYIAIGVLVVYAIAYVVGAAFQAGAR